MKMCLCCGVIVWMELNWIEKRMFQILAAEMSPTDRPAQRRQYIPYTSSSSDNVLWVNFGEVGDCRSGTGDISASIRLLSRTLAVGQPTSPSGSFHPEWWRLIGSIHEGEARWTEAKKKKSFHLTPALSPRAPGAERPWTLYKSPQNVDSKLVCAAVSSKNWL